jgi:hypothetical protein
MNDQLRQATDRLTTRLRDDESGAIMLAALAACMVLIMVTLIIWDAGRSARDKIDVQNAADSAAYSQAAVRARSMNMLAFTNVAKRSIVGMHSMYYGMFWGLAVWWAEQCGEGSRVASGDSRFNCNRNRRLLTMEGSDGGNWEQLVGNDFQRSQSVSRTKLVILRQMVKATRYDDLLFPNIPGWIGPEPDQNNATQQLFGNELVALDDYQRYLVRVTPWWAWLEGVTRATRNGATLASSFPLPGPVGNVQGPDWIRTAVNSADGYTFQPTPDAGEVFDFDVTCRGTNSAPGGGTSTWGPASGDSEPHALLRRNRAGEIEPGTSSCLPIQNPGFNSTTPDIQERAGGNQNTRSPLTDPVEDEINDNLGLHRRRSEADAHRPVPVTVGLAKAVSADRPGADPNAGGGCFWSMHLGWYRTNGNRNSCGNHRFPAVPYALNAASNSAPDLMARSNILFTYKYTPGRGLSVDNNDRVEGADEGQRTGGRNLLESAGYGLENPNSLAYRTEGYWSMARGEIVYPHGPDSDQPDPARSEVGGSSGMWMWRPGWTAKLRPMALPGEWDGLNYQLNDTYRATSPYLTLAGREFSLRENDDQFQGLNDVAQDLAFMHKATLTMDPAVMGGMTK